MKLRTILSRIKRKIYKTPFIRDPRYPAYWFDRVLGGKAAYLVQVGSNDGKTGDPLYPLLKKNKNWKALFVEPIPHFFKKLLQNYPDRKRFRFENCAVNEGENMLFYWVHPTARAVFPDLPYWYDQLGSFDREHIVKHFDGKLSPFIVSQQVEGIAFEHLLTKNQVANIDLLHIDAEGYDWKILRQLDLSRYQPSFILYEYHHLQEQEQLAAAAFLKETYDLFYLDIDALAVRREVDPALRARMRKTLIQKRL